MEAEAEAIDRNQFKYFSKYDDYCAELDKILNPKVDASGKLIDEDSSEHGPLWAAYSKIGMIVSFTFDFEALSV